MIVRMMFEPFTTVEVMFVFVTREPEDTMPTLVRSAGSVPVMKPEPVNTAVKVVPEAAVGRLAGLIPLTVAPADNTFTLIVTTIVWAGLPQVNVAVPVNTLPGTAAANRSWSNVTGIGVPKL